MVVVGTTEVFAGLRGVISMLVVDTTEVISLVLNDLMGSVAFHVNLVRRGPSLPF